MYILGVADAILRSVSNFSKRLDPNTFTDKLKDNLKTAPTRVRFSPGFPGEHVFRDFFADF
jgi:hypothetical protein